MDPKKSSSQVGAEGSGRQVHLPLSRAFEIAMKSIKIRFARNIITAAGIFLGIAFLVSVLMQGVLRWPAPPEDIKTGLVRVDGEINAPGDYDAWKDVTVDELAQAGMPQAAIAYAADGKTEFPLRQFAEGVAALKNADKQLPKAKAWLAGFERLPQDRLAKPKDDGKFTKDDLLKKYKWPEASVKRLLDTADSIAEKDMAAARDKARANVKAWTARQRELEIFRPVDKAKLDKLAAAKAYTVEEIIAAVKGTTKNANMDGLMIVNTNGRHIGVEMLKDTKAKRTRVAEGDYIMIPDTATKYRGVWLVIMSLMVCTLGICNSMLMSVTERFKEIGTMKCLGALNRFVVTLFLLESMFLGMVASFLGWFVGFCAMILSAGLSKGWGVVGQMGIGDALLVFVQAIAAGAFLTVVATIAPAIQAAKMPPAAALRVEI